MASLLGRFVNDSPSEESTRGAAAAMAEPIEWHAGQVLSVELTVYLELANENVTSWFGLGIGAKGRHTERKPNDCFETCPTIERGCPDVVASIKRDIFHQENDI